MASPTVDSDVSFARLDLGSIPALSLFHAQNLGGQLVRLGPSYIRYFYGQALVRSDVSGWAAYRQDRIVGFILGSTAPQGIAGRLIRQAPVRWAMAAATSAIRHPLHFMRAIQSLNEARNHPAAQARPELHYIAVRAEERGRRIGDGLMQRYIRELRECGVPQFELSVPANNAPAVRFYETQGGRTIYDYKDAGLQMRRYVFDVKSILHGKEGA